MIMLNHLRTWKKYDFVFVKNSNYLSNISKHDECNVNILN